VKAEAGRRPASSYDNSSSRQGLNPGGSEKVMDNSEAAYEALKREWTDQLVEVNPERPELARFRGIVGRVITVNRNNKAVIDFQDGGWYDITASAAYLNKLEPAAAKSKYDPKVNSAQPYPDKQG
jgi:hypothetical protein